MSYTGTAAIIGKGTIVAHSTTSGGSFTNFNEILKVSFPKPTSKDIDATNMDSGNYEETIQGMLSSGEIDVSQNYNKGDLVLLYGMLGVKTFFKITLPDGGTGSTFTFAGFVKEPTGDSGFGDKIETKWKLKITGGVTFTAGT